MDDIAQTQACFARKADTCPDHRFRDLFHYVINEEWLRIALIRVLRNAGSRTPGIDGVTRFDLTDDNQRLNFVKSLRDDLRAGTYHPSPVARIYIPKSNGKMRPLGIPTIRDRVVQMVLKMLLEPIWESDFLSCSNGFRPGRRTMDCIATCRRLISRQGKFFWVVEGDIKGCFDHINHVILLKLVRRRVRDPRVVKLIRAFLRAGILENGVRQLSEEGTPQGGVLSPLLANIYLHEFDRWWWERYGGIKLSQKARRRREGRGNVILTRYADDFILFCNGTHAEALKVREEVRQFLWDTLHLELSLEKTHVTHVTDGFDFLGFHLRYRRPPSGRPWLQIIPSKASVERFKRTIKEATRRKHFYQAPLEKLRGLNRVARGWNQYYEYVNATRTASALTFWINDRLFRWLRKRHKQTNGWTLRTYQHLEDRGQGRIRKNMAVLNDHGKLEFLYHLTDLRRRPYRRRNLPNPYLDPVLEVADPALLTETPFLKYWEGRTPPEKAAWFEMRITVMERDGYQCVRCSSTTRLHVHHRQERRKGGTDDSENLETLCERCHHTSTRWGRPKGTSGLTKQNK